MSNVPKPILEIDCEENGGLLKFYSPEEFKEWITKEENFWNWIPQNWAGGYPNQLKNFISNCFNKIKNPLTTYTNNPNDNSLRDLKKLIEEAFITIKLPLSKTPRAKLINEIKDADIQKAEFILCYFLNLTVQNATPKAFEAFMTAFAFDNNIKNTAKSEKKAIEELLDELSSKVTNVNAISLQLNNDVKQAEKTFAEQKSNIEVQFKELLSSTKNQIESNVEEAQAKLKQIENTYDEKLALQSGVRYWKTKAESHLQSSWIFGILSFGVGSVAGLGIYFTMDKLIGAAKLSDVQFWQLSMIALEAIFGVWLTRVFIRIYLSNMHLLSDAKERRVLLLTYLALLRKGGLQPAEQNLILSSLFRPTATGIIRDDAAPPFIAEWIKKTIGNE